LQISIILTAHGVDTNLRATSYTGAQSIIHAFAAGIGQKPCFDSNSLKERKVLKMDYFRANAAWFAEILN